MKVKFFIYLSVILFVLYLPQAISAEDEEITNSIGIKLRLIKAGEFMMGSENGAGDEQPIHNVFISKDFYIGICEVSQQQYERIMGKNPSHFRGKSLPVESVSWEEAQEFCRKLSQKEGREYRLPTEAEWEYACRAGTKTEYFYGDEYDKKHIFSADNTKSKTENIGTKKPNPWGLYDMAGNVWEWCQDWYSETAYLRSINIDPLGAGEGQYRVIRGGSWNYCDLCNRSAYRGSRAPETKSDTIGFRVVLEPKK